VRSAPPTKRAGQASGRRRLDGEILDVTTTAALIGVSEKCIRARVARRLIPHRRWGSRVVFLRAELLDFMRQLAGVSVDEALSNVAQRSGGD